MLIRTFITHHKQNRIFCILHEKYYKKPLISVLYIEEVDTLAKELVKILYCDEELYVEQEIAKYLEEDRKKQQALNKQDKRHLAMEDMESYDFHSKVFHGQKSVEDIILNKLENEILHEAIKTLPKECRSIIIERFFNQKTLKQISEETGLSMQVVFYRTKKAKNILKSACRNGILLEELK